MTASADDYLHLCKMVKLVGEKEPIFGPKEWEEVTTAMCEYFSEGMCRKPAVNRQIGRRPTAVAIRRCGQVVGWLNGICCPARPTAHRPVARVGLWWHWG